MSAQRFTLQHPLAGAPEVDTAIRARAGAFAEQAGLRLAEQLQEQLYAAAPYALEMARHIRRGHTRSEEPCNVFRLPSS